MAPLWAQLYVKGVRTSPNVHGCFLDLAFSMHFGLNDIQAGLQIALFQFVTFSVKYSVKKLKMKSELIFKRPFGASDQKNTVLSCLL